MAKWVYAFGDGRAEGSSGMRDLLGGKGANLAEMANLGLPVPPGFTVTTEVCTHFYANGRAYPPELEAQVAAALARVGELDRARLRRPAQPAARVGPLRRAGLDARHDGHRPEPRPQRRAPSRRWPPVSSDERFAFDSYRRFIQMYSNVVLGIDHHNFEDILEYYKERQAATCSTPTLRPHDWRHVVGEYKAKVAERDRAARSRRTRTPSCGAPSGRSSRPG